MVAWEKRMTEGKYTSPSSKESVFLWGSLSKETDLKTGLFTFPDKDGAIVQHQGAGATSFPLTCIFNGSNCMEFADAFENMLFEKGVGELQHPVYGVHKVVPHGKVKRVDDMLSGLGDSVVEVTFIKIISNDMVPKLKQVEVDDLDEIYNELANVACEDFASNLKFESVDEKIKVQADLKAVLENMKVSLSSVSNDLNAELKIAKQAVNEMFANADSVVGAGLNVARVMLNIIAYPSKVAINISEKTKGYSLLISKLITQFRNDPVGINNVANSIMTTRLVLGGAIASLASGVALQSMSSSDFELSEKVFTRADAMNAGIEIINMFETIKQFDDAKVSLNSFVDTNAEFYFLLQDLIYKCVLIIVNSSFVLPIRKTIVLDRDRQLIELCTELYGSLDYLDNLIFENKLKNDDIILLPMGKEISYYVKSA